MSDKISSTLIDKLAAEYLGHSTVNSAITGKTARVKTAGEIRHVRDTGPIKRQNIGEHNYRAKDLKKLTRILWHLSVCLGHLGSGVNQFAKLKSVHISPDGRLGGRGYDKAITDIRKELYSALEGISAAQDTIFDEISAPHWKPTVKDLPKKDQEEVQEMIGEVEDIREDPDAYGDATYDTEIEEDARKKNKGKKAPEPDEILPE